MVSLPAQTTVSSCGWRCVEFGLLNHILSQSYQLPGAIGAVSTRIVDDGCKCASRTLTRRRVCVARPLVDETFTASPSVSAEYEFFNAKNAQG